MTKQTNRRLSTIPLAVALVCLTGALPVAALGQGQGRGGGRGGAQGDAGGRGQQRDLTAQQTIGTGVISGDVVADGSGTPVRHARVQLSSAELRGGRSAVTDEQGHFAFSALPAGRYTMTASKASYVAIAYGAKKPGRPGTPIQLADGQHLERATITMPRGAVVTGRVIDENGEPSPGTPVRVMRFVMRTGEKTLQQAGQDQTDDRGIYRVYGLQPGDYLVSAMPRNMNVGDLRQTMAAEIDALLAQAQAAGVAGGGRGQGGRGGAGGAAGVGALLGGGGRGQQLLDRATQLQQQLDQQQDEQTVAYAPVYYPGTPTPAQASSVTLTAGEERGAVDFQLQLVQTARLQGSITSPDGELPAGTQIVLMPAGQQGTPPVPGAGTSSARVDRTGAFILSGVTPGQYTLMARAAIRQAVDPNAPAQPGQRGGPPFGGRGGRGGPIAQMLWASLDVTVSGQDLAGLALTLQPGMTVSGRIAFDASASAPPSDLSRARVNLVPQGEQMFDTGSVPPAQVDASGHFKIVGVLPGRYTFRANVPPDNSTQGGRGGRGGGRGGFGGAAGGSSLKSAEVGGFDTLDFPFEVHPNEDVGGAVLTFGDQTQELSGTLQDATGQPTSDFTIIVFPSDKRYWLPQARRIQSARPATDGRFSFRNLPPGDYRMTAVTDVEPGEWYDPSFLSQLTAASIPFTLNPGEQKMQDVKVARQPPGVPF